MNVSQISSMESNRDRNWDVLNHVLARGPSACDKFREALVAEGEPQSLIELLPLFEDQYQNTLDEVESDASTQSGEEVRDHVIYFPPPGTPC